MNVRSYSVNEGLPQSQVMAIQRDAQGYLWVGTYSGPARYNGQTWTSFDHHQGMPGLHITSFLAGPAGELWVGTFGHGISRFSDGQFRSFDPTTPQGSAVVNQMLLDGQGRVWAATDLGLLCFKGSEVTQYTEAEGLPQTRVLALYEDGGGVIYVGTQSGLVALVNDHIQPLPFGSTFQNMSVDVVIEDQDRRLWVGTREGLFYVEGSQVSRHPDPILGTCAIANAALEPKTGIWFGTNRNGVFKIEGVRITRTLSEANGLSNPVINSLFFDEEETLWIGTDASLYKYRPSQFVAFNSQHGLDNVFSRTLCLGPDHSVLVGTRDGIYQIDEALKIHKWDTSGLSSQRIYDIHQMDDGGLAVVTESSLGVIHNGKTINYGKEEGQRSDNLRSGLIDHTGRIWVGADGLFWLENGVLRGFPPDHPLGHVRLLDIVEDPDGVLWIGSWDGLIIFNPATGEVRIPEDQNPSIWDLDLDGKGGIWMATNGQGLWHYDGNTFVKYTSENTDIGNDFIWQVHQDRSGTVWAGHNQGLARFQDGKFTIFTTNDGLASNEGCATAVIEDELGRIWFGTGTGVTLYLPFEGASTSSLAKVVVEQVLVTNPLGQSQPVAPGTVLDHAQNNLNLRFAALSFVKEESVTYSYLLEGLDRQWSEPNHLAEVKYIRLPPTAYQFRIKARNGDGAWSEEEVFAFEIKPAFYQRTSFQVTLLLLAILGVFAYTRARLQLVKRRNRELEILVAQRTEDLAEKNREFRELSLSDPLTKVRNRRYVTEIMREEVGRLRRRYFRYQEGNHFTCVAFMILDLDHFKSVNDRYGHDVGDKILVETAERLQQVVRDSDVVARWGGEEFLIVFRDIQVRDLPLMAYKLLECIRSMPYSHGQSRMLQRTTSLGFAYLHPSLVQRETPWEWVLKLADMALYQSKSTGRNQAIGIDYPPAPSAADWEKLCEQVPEKSFEEELLSYRSV